MKKSYFIPMILSTVSCILFALGMCGAMLPQWNGFRAGTAANCAGLLSGILTVFFWKKVEHREPVRISPKTVGMIYLGIIGALTFGTGMCLAMVWAYLVPGMIIGFLGIFLLICLIPICMELE